MLIILKRTDVAEAVQRVTPPLFQQAANGGIISFYGDVNRAHINMPSILDRHMGTVLDHPSELCAQNGWPDVTALVVNRATGLPGIRWKGFQNVAPQNHAAVHQSVVASIRSFNWLPVIEQQFGEVTLKMRIRIR